MLKFTIENHRLNPAEFIPSPNQDDLPSDPSLIVMHYISLPPGKFGGQGVVDLFTNQLNPNDDLFYRDIAGLKVSAHLLIRRNGRVIQFVPFNRRAWHAGVSSYQGRQRCNDFSLGIELEGTGDTPFTHSQYQSLFGVIAALKAHYPSLNQADIVGHSDIAPNRKMDPGPYFRWDSLLQHI